MCTKDGKVSIGGKRVTISAILPSRTRILRASRDYHLCLRHSFSLPFGEELRWPHSDSGSAKKYKLRRPRTKTRVAKFLVQFPKRFPTVSFLCALHRPEILLGPACHSLPRQFAWESTSNCCPLYHAVLSHAISIRDLHSFVALAFRWFGFDRRRRAILRSLGAYSRNFIE